MVVRDTSRHLKDDNNLLGVDDADGRGEHDAVLKQGAEGQEVDGASLGTRLREDIGRIRIPRHVSLGSITVVVEADTHHDGVGLDVEHLGVGTRGDGRHFGLNDFGNGNGVSHAVELVSANGRCRNLRTDFAKDVSGDIGVVLCIASELGKGKIETILIEEVGDLLLGVVVSAVVEFQCVECLAVVSTPVCKETYAGIGIGLSIGVVDVEVRVGDTGVNGHIVSIALALVIEDIVEHMDIGRVLATEGASGGLFGTTIKGGSVIINIDVTAEGVDPDAGGDKLGGGGSTERNHVVVDGNTVDIGTFTVVDHNASLTAIALVDEVDGVALDADALAVGNIDGRERL